MHLHEEKKSGLAVLKLAFRNGVRAADPPSFCSWGLKKLNYFWDAFLSIYPPVAEGLGQVSRVKIRIIKPSFLIFRCLNISRDCRSEWILISAVSTGE